MSSSPSESKSRKATPPLVASIRKRSSDSPLKFFQVIPASTVTSVKMSGELNPSAKDRQNKMNREDGKNAKKDEEVIRRRHRTNRLRVSANIGRVAYLLFFIRQDRYIF